MIVYSFAFCLSVLITWIFSHSVQYKKNKYMVFMVLVSGMPLFLVAALRYGIGTDFMSYVSIYNNYSSQGVRGSYEVLFYLISYGLGLINADVQWLFVICAGIFVFCVFYVVFIDSNNPSYSIIILFGITYYFAMLNIMRQLVACAILFVALHFLSKKEYIKYFICVIIASGFHYISLIFFALIVFQKIKLSPRVVLFVTGILMVLRPVIGKIVPLMFTDTKYAKYFDESYDTTSLAGILGILVQIIILLFCSYTYSDNNKYKTYYLAQVLCTWSVIFNGVIPYASRIKYVFGLATIVLLPLAINNLRSKCSKGLFYYGIVVSYIVYAYIIVYITGSYGVLPYQSVI